MIYLVKVTDQYFRAKSVFARRKEVSMTYYPVASLSLHIAGMSQGSDCSVADLHDWGVLLLNLATKVGCRLSMIAAMLLPHSTSIQSVTYTAHSRMYSLLHPKN